MPTRLGEQDRCFPWHDQRVVACEFSLELDRVNAGMRCQVLADAPCRVAPGWQKGGTQAHVMGRIVRTGTRHPISADLLGRAVCDLA